MPHAFMEAHKEVEQKRLVDAADSDFDLSIVQLRHFLARREAARGSVVDPFFFVRLALWLFALRTIRYKPFALVVRLAVVALLVPLLRVPDLRRGVGQPRSELGRDELLEKHFKQDLWKLPQ